jgi:serine/threonine protein kinase/Tol biopolymer transport system component
LTLQPGVRLGRYEIVAPLGAGGMGEVYRARDSSLDREVAIKVLPHGTADRPDARERLAREARSLSRLSHPHICAVHDVGEDRGSLYLVMELLEGETLAARIARGPIGVTDTLRVGREIAEALAGAHRQGIVHRDLKPGNVMLTPGGVKLLDFGLAKAVAPMAAESAVTVGRGLTVEGTVIGTLQYMSPEQMEGKPADARSDIFALGAVLCEMATGRPAFTGDSATAVAAAVLTAEPPPITGAPALDRIVRGCLAKDPDRRWQSAQDVALQLATTGDNTSVAVTRPRRSWPAWLPWAIAALAVAVAIAIVSQRPAPQVTAAASPVAFTVAPPPGLTFRSSVERIPFAVSPDGTMLAFAAGSSAPGSRIFLRPLASVEATPLAGTEGAQSLFWSPDGRSIGFFAAGKLRQVAIAGGAPVTICAVREGIGLTGSWGADGQIIFASVEGEAIFRVPTSGGTPAADLTPDKSQGEMRFVWPAFLPDGRRYLYTVTGRDDVGGVRLAEPGRPSRALVNARSPARYIDPGYLLFVEDAALLARRFDLSSGTVSGDTIPVADEITYFRATGGAQFTASASGVLAYSTGSEMARLAWFDRTGRETGELRAPDGYLNLRISSDGKELLFDRLARRTRHYDIWSLDLARGLETRLTSSPETEVNPQFGPSGTMIYSSSRGSSPRLVRRVLATGVIEGIVPEAAPMQLAADVSTDKKWVLYTERTGRGNFDVYAVPLGGGAPVPIATTAFNETQPSFSPDGRLIAFISDETGRPEVYVAPFASPHAKRLVSTGGGFLPRWDRARGELVYLGRGTDVMSVRVDNATTGETGTPKSLFKLAKGAEWNAYDLAPDGRFLAVIPVQSSGQQPLTVIVNWPATLRR